MSENDFQTKVLDAISDMRTDLATTTAELKGCVQRLDQQAETVTQHQAAIGKLQIEIAERRLACPLVADVKDDLVSHIMQCPMKARLDIVEEFISVTRAMAVSNKHWLDRMWPFIYAVSGVAVYVAAMHANDLLKVMSR